MLRSRRSVQRSILLHVSSIMTRTNPGLVLLWTHGRGVPLISLICPPFISVDCQMDRQPLCSVAPVCDDIRPSSCQSSMRLETFDHSRHASPSSLIIDHLSSHVPRLFQLQLDYDMVSLCSACYTAVASSRLSSTVSTFSHSSWHLSHGTTMNYDQQQLVQQNNNSLTSDMIWTSMQMTTDYH